MAFERPTFHESWYRVAELHPRLRSTVQISRQHYRSQAWHVVQDHTNNAFFRLSEPAYRMIGLLDGKRTVGEAWKICNEQMGDDAPTQAEAIQLLGQLYTANLLQTELPADTHGLFNRYKKRVQREIQSYLMNIMFIRLPLLDPDRFLEKWMPLFGWVFSWIGFAVWIGLMSVAFYALASVPNFAGKLFSASQNVFDPSNLILLYIGFAGIKACHEFGHAISCKKFGLASGVGGEVHTIGIMFLVFNPVPYVDASSSWALRSKWQRIIVGAAGMWVELGIASICAIVWAKTQETTLAHTLAYNMMFVASVSTIIFNANPLLRYDGYYILSDLLEIPNLAQRANEYVYYVVKKYAWGLKQVRSPAHTPGERFWLLNYAWTSFTMRVVVSFGIMFYLASVLNGALIIIAAIMGLAGAVTWVLMPLGKFVHYLATNGELTRVRTRAVVTTVGAVAVVLALFGGIPFPDHVRAQGLIDPEESPELRASVGLTAKEAGFIEYIRESGPEDARFSLPKVKAGAVVVRLKNQELENELKGLQADRDRLESKLRAAMMEDPGAAQIWRRLLKNQDEQIAAKEKRIADLEIQAPIGGVEISPKVEDAQGMYLNKGDKIGEVADLDMKHLVVRVDVPNEYSGPLEREVAPRVEIRVQGRPDLLLTGRIYKVVPSGQTELSYAGLGYSGGGQLAVRTDDKKGTKTQEEFFEVYVRDLAYVHETADAPALLGNQRVMVRFVMNKKPLAAQAWTALRQMIQKRFSA